MTTAVSIFDVDGSQTEVGWIRDAVTALRPDVRLWLEGHLPRHVVSFVDSIPATSSGIQPEALYPGNRTIKMNRFDSQHRILGPYRQQGNFIHEVGHGVDKYVIGATKEVQLLNLFEPVPAGWRINFKNYWHIPYESFCDWWVRVATDGRIISHWEDKRLLIPNKNLDKILPILMDDPELPTPTPPAVDPPVSEEEEMPLSQVVEMQRGAVAAGTPILHPVTLAVLFTSSGNPSSRLMGVTPDGKYRGIMVVTNKIAGNGWKIALINHNKVTNVRIEDPTAPIRAELDATNASLEAAEDHIVTLQEELAAVNDKSAADVIDAQSIVTRHQ